VIGITPIGRTTIAALKLNRPLALAIREEEKARDRHPPLRPLQIAALFRKSRRLIEVEKADSILVLDKSAPAKMIHSTAIIAPGAEVDSSCEVGAYCVVDGNVRVGAGCRLGSHVHLTGHTEIGARNVFHSGCVIGDGPQDLKYRDEPTRLRIGDNNVFREHVTVHRSAKLGDETIIGSGNFMMASAHIGHNCHLGDNIIIANGALLGGHVTVEDRVFISGTCLLHQFVRIGTLALMQGGAGVSKDLPPFTIATGNNHICGLNIIGLRRAGILPQDRLELKRLYRRLFRNGESPRAAAETVDPDFASAHSRTLLEFVRASKRGVCTDISAREEAPDAD
jgi:UDP-N-acetylglucosamine acyltransferase